MNPMQKLRLVVARGILNLVKNAGLQVVQINLLEGETRDEVERVQNFGFSGNPPPGATVVAVAVGGSRDHMMVVACEHPDYPPALETGEAAMYAQFGQLFKMDKDGNVKLTCKDFTVESSGKASIQAAEAVAMTTPGSLSIAAESGSDIKGGLNADLIDGDIVRSNDVVLDTHTHEDVQSGTEQSGVPVK